ncbi:hypothetical protein BDZ94DRAFT_1325444 [Collybia nuda]|uniref:AB hydrolase-1 domain-containing protein n=1 Tax=Collybia nuda TaxID=64659 RepID=A0A9P5XXB1_9AGAR|nr:hypothetical protein BDZ94DRAFT_1325444 [Collybia nuda]
MSQMFKFLESQILFMNAIKLPLFADFTHPEKYGLLEKQTLNLTIRTPDNETLGACRNLVAEGTRPEDILVVGHSLGTGVASQLGAQLSKEGIGCCGVVLLSPFSSVPEALSTYNIFGAIPLTKPLSLIPPLPSMITQALIHKFDTLSTISDIKYPILIAHATDDWVIPHTHSDILFTALLEPALPHLPPPRNALHLTPEEVTAEEDRRARREELVTHTDLPGVGGCGCGGEGGGEGSVGEDGQGGTRLYWCAGGCVGGD